MFASCNLYYQFFFNCLSLLLPITIGHSQTTQLSKVQWDFVGCPQNVIALANSNDGYLFAVTEEDVFVLRCLSSQWSRVLSKKNLDSLCGDFAKRYNEFRYTYVTDSSKWIPKSQRLLSMVTTKDSVIICITQEGYVIRSADNGCNWQKTGKITIRNFGITGLYYAQSTLFVTCIGDNKILRSSDDGFTWSATNIKVNGDARITKILFSESKTGFASTNYDGVYISRDGGNNWIQSQLTANARVFFIAKGEDDQVYSNMLGGIFIFNESLNEWQKTELRIPDLPLSIRQKEILIQSGSSIKMSSDGGTTYKTVFDGIEKLDITCFAYEKSGNLFIGTRGPVWQFNDELNKWTTDGYFGNKFLTLASDSSGNLFLLTDKGLFKSSDQANSWRLITSNKDFKKLSITTNGYFLLSQKKVLVSFDKGKNWDVVKFLFRGDINLVECGNNGRLFLGTTFGLYTSTDKGISWNLITDNIPSQPITSIIQTATGDLYLGRDDGSILKSSNMGDQWKSITTNSYSCFDFNPRNQEQTSHLINRPWPNRYVGKIIILPNGKLLADIGDLLILPSTDSAWFGIDFNLNSSLRGISEWKPNRVVLASKSQILLSSDNLNSWHSIEEGLPLDYGSQTNATIDAFALGQYNTIFVGINGKGIFKSK